MYELDEHGKNYMTELYDLDKKIFIEENIVYPFFDENCAREIEKAISYISSSDIPEVLNVIEKTSNLIDEILKINAQRLAVEAYNVKYVDYHRNDHYIINPAIRCCYPRNRSYITEQGFGMLRMWSWEYSEISDIMRDKSLNGKYADFISHICFRDLIRDYYWDD